MGKSGDGGTTQGKENMKIKSGMLVLGIFYHVFDTFPFLGGLS
jgi:hypothetical protein